MDINHDLYKIFCYVAKYGSFTKAAEKLYVSQSAITQSMKKLEDELGGRLFIRSRSGAALTYEGERLFEYISNSIETLNHANEIFSQYKNLENGIIRISCGSTLTKIFLIDTIKKFVEKYPNITVNVENTKAVPALKKLSLGEVNIVVTSYNPNLKYDNLNVQKVCSTHECFFTTKNYYEKVMKKDDKIENINKYLIALPLTGTSYREIIINELEEKNMKISSKYEFSSANALVEFVIKVGGIGITAKEYIKEELESGKLVGLYNEIKFPSTPIVAITLNKRLMGNATRQFVKFMLDT